MEGRKGADKVVDVPLGTLVWQLAEMQQAPGSTAVPHGVTPLPRVAAAAPVAAAGAAVASRHMQQQQQQRQTLPDADQQLAITVQSVSHSSGTTCSTGRRKLFPEISQQQQQQQQQQHGLPAAAPSAAAGTEELSCDHADALYEDLLKCRRLLTNAEKLWLLNNGSLPTPQQLLRHNARTLEPAAAAADYTDSEQEVDDDADELNDDEPLSDDDDDWVVLPPAEGDEAAAGAASWMDDMEAERQFTKQQVGLGGRKPLAAGSTSNHCCMIATVGAAYAVLTPILRAAGSSDRGHC
jgi:hypothetical protein